MGCALPLINTNCHEDFYAMEAVLWQIAAFGNFDAERQRLLFGLKKCEDICDGRLSFYCQKVNPNERPKIYRAIDKALDIVSKELNELNVEGNGEAEIFMSFAGKSIAERIGEAMDCASLGWQKMS